MFLHARDNQRAHPLMCARCALDLLAAEAVVRLRAKAQPVTVPS
jgi:hypothetical protein